jgi:hypothetical protein
MKYRKLRIAWPVFWGLACVLLIVLWVRSYRTRDTAIVNLSGRNFQANSILGRLSFATLNQPIGQVRWHTQSRPVTIWDSQQEAQFPRFSITSVSATSTSRTEAYGVGMPYWAWLLLPVTTAAVPWIGKARRFSLRTLLIATTLVAVVLGLAVWAARK